MLLLLCLLLTRTARRILNSRTICFWQAIFFLIFHSLGRQAKYLFCVQQQELWGLVEILKLVLVLTNKFFLCHHSLWSWFKLALDRIKPYFEIWYFDDGFSILHFKRFFPMLNSVEKYQLVVFCRSLRNEKCVNTSEEARMDVSVTWIAVEYNPVQHKSLKIQSDMDGRNGGTDIHIAVIKKAWWFFKWNLKPLIDFFHTK